MHDILISARRFCVNVLHHDQASLSAIFAGAELPEGGFRHGAWRYDADGLPLLSDAQASIVCRRTAALPFGTHTIFVGKVLDATHREEIAPLIYENASYCRSTPLKPCPWPPDCGQNPKSWNHSLKGSAHEHVTAGLTLQDHAAAAIPSTLDGVREAVRAALPEIRKRAALAEQNRQVPLGNVALLREAGFFRLVQPRVHGGLEQDFEALVALVIDISAACASTGWVCGLAAAHQWLVANFPLAAQTDVWADSPDWLICGSYAPAGKVVSVANGWRASGRWSFASGCDVTSWAVCGTLLPAGQEGGPPVAAFLLVPESDYRIDDTWNTIGLAGTGSKTLVLEDVFVPAHRMVTFRDTCAGASPGASVHANPLYRLPMLSCIASCLAATAVGAAQGALDEYLAATSRRVTRGAVAGSNNRMAEFPTIQLRVAEAAASIDAARTILLRDLRIAMDTAQRGDIATVEQRITARRGQAFAVSLAVRAAEALNASTGGQGLDMANPVQRAWRDANAVGRHISMNWDAVGTMFGQMALGLEPKGQF